MTKITKGKRGADILHAACRECGTMTSRFASSVGDGSLLRCAECRANRADKSHHGYIIRYINGRYRPLHRVIAEKMLGRKLKRYEVVHHINEDPTDNRLENLQVMSRGAHIALHRKDKPGDRGAANGNSKLTEAEVLAIRKDTRKYRDIAVVYGVTFGLISHIKNRRVWKHLP